MAERWRNVQRLFALPSLTRALKLSGWEPPQGRARVAVSATASWRRVGCTGRFSGSLRVLQAVVDDWPPQGSAQSRFHGPFQNRVSAGAFRGAEGALRPCRWSSKAMLCACPAPPPPAHTAATSPAIRSSNLGRASPPDPPPGMLCAVASARAARRRAESAAALVCGSQGRASPRRRKRGRRNRSPGAAPSQTGASEELSLVPGREMRLVTLFIAAAVLAASAQAAADSVRPRPESSTWPRAPPARAASKDLCRASRPCGMVRAFPGRLRACRRGGGADSARRPARARPAGRATARLKLGPRPCWAGRGGGYGAECWCTARLLLAILRPVRGSGPPRGGGTGAASFVGCDRSCFWVQAAALAAPARSAGALAPLPGLGSRRASPSGFRIGHSGRDPPVALRARRRRLPG